MKDSPDGSMPALDIDSLLAPLSGDAPCGADLEYDAAFQALQAAASGKPERQYGATVIPAEPADWSAVHQQALALAARTRDLRVAVWLTRSAARVDGFAAAAKGLELLRGLVEMHWAAVHPALDASDHDDPTARLNALAPLIHDEGLADLRAAALTPSRGSITVRDLEIAFGRVEPRPGEAAPTEQGIAPALVAAQSQMPGLAAAMASALESVQVIDAALKSRLGDSLAPDLAPLLKLLRSVASAGAVAQGGTVPTAVGAAAAAAGTTAQSAAQSTAMGAINSREDAIRALQRVSDWIERNEPSHPAPILIQRAQRLMKKNFVEIIRDLMPDGLGQIEKLAGTVHD